MSPVSAWLSLVTSTISPAMADSFGADSVPAGTNSGPTRSSSSWSGRASLPEPNRARCPETWTMSSAFRVPEKMRTTLVRPE